MVGAEPGLTGTQKRKELILATQERKITRVDLCDEERQAVDATVHALEAKWGCGRLESLCRDPELKAKFDRQRQKYNDAFWDADIDVGNVQLQATKMIRGYEALEAHAIKVGIEPLAKLNKLEYQLDNGDVWVITPNAGDYHKEPGDERQQHAIGVNTLIDHFIETTAKSALPAVLREFSGARVSKITNLDIDPDDELPF